MQFDFKKNTIWFSDINGFFRDENASLVGADGSEPELAHLFSRQSTSYDHYGRAYKINLNKYGIKLLKDKKRYYIPLQTLNDLFMTRRGATILFNGKSLIAGGGDSLSDVMILSPYSIGTDEALETAVNLYFDISTVNFWMHHTTPIRIN